MIFLRNTYFSIYINFHILILDYIMVRDRVKYVFVFVFVFKYADFVYLYLYMYLNNYSVMYLYLSVVFGVFDQIQF